VDGYGEVVAEGWTASRFEQEYPREGDLVEFKAGAGADALQRSLVAFSNTIGGAVLIGVEDNGRILGQADPYGVIAKVHRVLRDIRDLGQYGIDVLDVDGRYVVRVQVRRRISGFAQLASGLVLVRRGEHDVPLFGAELATFLMGRQLQRFESQTVEPTLADADDALVEELVSVHGWSPDAENVAARLRERGLVDAAGSDRLTVAGALFLAPATPSLGKAYIEVRRYPDEGDAYDKRSRVDGPPQTQVREATERVLDELGNEFIVAGTHRYELPKLPPEVVREAVANAVAHRSYEASGTATVIELRPGRVVVRSPGGLPEGVTVANLRDAQSSRNLVVLDVLRRFHVAEDAGRGIDVMQDRMAEALLDPPRFADLGHAFEVILPVHSPITPDERAWVLSIEAEGQIQRADRLLLVRAARGHRVTNAVARDALNIDSAAARAALQRLCDAGLLVRHGARGGSYYVLAPHLGGRAAPHVSTEEAERLVLTYAEHLGPISNQRVRDLTDLDERQALALLQRLVDRGELVRVGDRRGTRYVKPPVAQG
jgi:ATP-dependent DNA helicase RecG